LYILSKKKKSERRWLFFDGYDIIILFSIAIERFL